MRKQAEMSIEVKENGQYVEHIAYPYVESQHMTFENGMQIEKALEDDVAMPTVTHETSSFKVGQGDSDVSESIVDSSVTSMTIKGQTYQNILPSPTLRNSMTDGNTMQKINEGYDSVEVVDGNVKSAILKGNTLVNLAESKMVDLENNRLQTIKLKTSLKANTDYTLVSNISNNDNTGITLYGVNETGSLLLVTVKNNGLIKTLLPKEKITSDCKSLRLQLSASEYESGRRGKFDNIVLLEGDYTNVDIPYFEGMQSVKMPVLTTTGKNLFNKNDVSYNTKMQQNLDDIYDKNHVSSNFIKVSPETNYYISGLTVVVAYDENKKYISILRDSAVEGTFLTPKNCKYIRLRNWNLLLEDEQRKFVERTQLEYGTIKTPYEPHKSNILTVNEDVTLRSNGSVCDELDLLTGKLTQRIDEDGGILTQEVVKTVDLSILNQDNQPIEQLQSYANGYIQLSSNVAEGEYSLTPSIDYEVPTSNSYYVDLMKANTQYTMKNMQGTFTLDGTQYNASVNGTFMSPSTLSNKFMVTSVSQSQPMLLEGDMTSEEVPYVDGIKSTFEGVDKVEIYSVGKNLCDNSTLRWDAYIDNNGNISTVYQDIFSDFILVDSSCGIFTTTWFNTIERTNFVFYWIVEYDEDKVFISKTRNYSPTSPFTLNSKTKYVRINLGGELPTQYTNRNEVQVVISYELPTTYEPHKSNTTSFPITNPLRSLPNGVRDEIVLDRMSNKAKLIQRVGEDLTQLPSPIVTQVDIEGFPYVYKDGHIFLNTEVAPTTEVKYSINQSQIIESQSEDIVRHSKEIDNLYNLIATYVQVIYDSTLLNLKTKGV